MKKILTLLLGLLPLYSIADSIEITGAEMTYTYVGGRDYEVKLNIYTRCNQTTMDDSVFIKVSSPKGSFISYAQVAEVKDMGEVDIQCKAIRTECTDPMRGFPGFKKWTATSTFSLSTNIACEYIFSWQGCCRSSLFTNGAAGQPFYIDAYANLCDNLKLSSPEFESDYSPWMSSGMCSSKSNAAIGAFGSQFTYSYQLTSPKAEYNKDVTYDTPFTARKPFTNIGGFSDQDIFDTKKGCWGFHLNNLTGELNVYPTEYQEIFPVSVNLLKFSNGKLISRITRDVLYWTSSNLHENRKPVITGIDCKQKYDTTLAPNQPVCLTFCSFDPDIDDTVSLSAIMNVPGGKLTIEEGKKWPKAQFCWTPTAADIRNEPYSIIMYAIDNTLCGEAFGLPGYNTKEQIILVYVRDPNAPSGTLEINNRHNLKIYPQPSSSKVFTDIPERDARKVMLIDMTGRSINPEYTLVNGRLAIDISTLPAGSYLLQAITDKNIYSGKVIVTK